MPICDQQTVPTATEGDYTVYTMALKLGTSSRASPVHVDRCAASNPPAIMYMTVAATTPLSLKVCAVFSIPLPIMKFRVCMIVHSLLLSMRRAPLSKMLCEVERSAEFMFERSPPLSSSLPTNASRPNRGDGEGGRPSYPSIEDSLGLDIVCIAFSPLGQLYSVVLSSPMWTGSRELLLTLPTIVWSLTNTVLTLVLPVRWCH